jgi:hypothetical protein
VVNDTTITADSPAGTGTVNVTVTTPSGTSPTSPAGQFTYTAVAAPTVTGLSPTSAPAAGSTPVTITGTGFTGATAVDFGTNPATNLTVVNDTTITADSPAGTGIVNVTVTTPGGTSPTSQANQFTYTAAPTVTGLSPTSGPAAGGTLVTITGTGFTGASAVDFGTTAATNFNVVNATTITADSPPGTGTVNVTVTTPGGTSPASQAGQFTYIVAAPTVSGLSPNSGPATGGTLVTIAGTGFTGATAVHFGTAAATNVTVVSGTTITADSPAGAGTVNVTVTTPGGTSPTSPADQFTFAAVAAPTVSGISPNSGPGTGGTVVTIIGTGFTGATAVHFGTAAATGVTVVSGTTITATSPAGAGIVNVTVTTPSGTSPATPADQFSFTVVAAPTVVSVLRFGFHAQPTSLVLTFSSALDPTRAQNVNNYQIVTTGGHGKNGNLIGHLTPVSSAVYDPTNLTVTVFPAQRLDLHNLYQLAVTGTPPNGLTSVTGVPLDGVRNGKPGTDYVVVISGKLLAGPALSASSAARKRLVAHLRVTKSLSVSAVDQLLAFGKLNARPNSAPVHSGRNRPHG